MTGKNNLDNVQLEVMLHEDRILVVNPRGRCKSFPRCGITLVESFVKEMILTGDLDELLFD